MNRIVDFLLGALALAILLLIIVFTRPPTDPPERL